MGVGEGLGWVREDRGQSSTLCRITLIQVRNRGQLVCAPNLLLAQVPIPEQPHHLPSHRPTPPSLSPSCLPATLSAMTQGCQEYPAPPSPTWQASLSRCSLNISPTGQ